jgi:hypothetical protein
MRLVLPIALGLAWSSTAGADEWRGPFAGSPSARVTLVAPSGDLARKAAVLVGRLAALGVKAEAADEAEGQLVLRLTGVRDAPALVQALLRDDWWALHLVEPEQSLPVEDTRPSAFPFDWSPGRVREMICVSDSRRAPPT